MKKGAIIDNRDATPIPRFQTFLLFGDLYHDDHRREVGASREFIGYVSIVSRPKKITI